MLVPRLVPRRCRSECRSFEPVGRTHVAVSAGERACAEAVPLRMQNPASMYISTENFESLRRYFVLP